MIRCWFILETTQADTILYTISLHLDTLSCDLSVQRHSLIWMGLTDAYASTGNAEKIAELIEVQAAQTGDRNQTKQQDPHISLDKDWDNDDSWRILDPLNVGRNESLTMEVLGMIRSYNDCDFVKNIFSISTAMAHDDGITHEKRRDTNAIMCPFELNGVCNDDGCQVLLRY